MAMDRMRNPYAPPQASVERHDAPKIDPRPKEITWAARLMWTSVSVGLGFAIVNALATRSLSTLGVAGVVVVAIFILGFLAWTVFWIRKIREGRNWARVLFLASFLLSALSTGRRLPLFFAQKPFLAAEVLLQTVLSFVVVYLLFASKGRFWFQRDREPDV